MQSYHYNNFKVQLVDVTIQQQQFTHNDAYNESSISRVSKQYNAISIPVVQESHKVNDVWNAIDLSPSASITLSPSSCTRLDVVGLFVLQMKSKRARSIYGTLSVCGFVTNIMPLEPVPVWTPFDCCLILIQKIGEASRPTYCKHNAKQKQKRNMGPHKK